MDLFNTKIPSTESRSHLNDSYEPFVSDISNGLYRSDHFSVAESSYSFSVVCRPYAMDYPFPSIHNQAQSEEYLDPQFSVDCVYGGGSMLSSLDLSLDSCLGMLITSLPHKSFWQMRQKSPLKEYFLILMFP